MKTTSGNPYISVIPQRSVNDCAAACLAMLLGVSYEAAIVAFRRELTYGVQTREIRAAAGRLGVKLHWSRKYDLENDTGILAVRSKQWHCDHLVLLREGLIIDTDATVWEADMYLAAYAATPLSLMTRRGSDVCTTD